MRAKKQTVQALIFFSILARSYASFLIAARIPITHTPSKSGLQKRGHKTLNGATLFLVWKLFRRGQAAWRVAMDRVGRRNDISTDHLPPVVTALADAKCFSDEAQPGNRSRLGFTNKNVRRSTQDTKILKEFFAT